MDKFMTREQMESEFTSEWVLVENPQFNDAMQLLGGTVRFHSTDRDEMYRKAVEIRPKWFTTVYTGTLPDDVVVVLL
jgi:hypothetical protein